MNRITKSFIWFALTLLFAGCTLMMEDYSIPEEKRGVGEVYTEEVEGVGTISYQYNEGVKPVTSSMQEFIAQVEDSTIYFYDYMPEKHLPVVGGYVAAGCSRILPHGLNHKVKSVERIAGLYKVELNTASLEDVYSDLDYDLDFDYDCPAICRDSTSEDTIYTDWSLVDKMNGTSFYTRADDDKKDNEDEYDKEENKNSEFVIKYDTRNNVTVLDQGILSNLMKLLVFDPMHTAIKEQLLPKVPDKLKDAFFLGFEFSSKSKTNIKRKFSKKDKYEKSVTTTTTTNRIMFETGFEIKEGVGGYFPFNNTGALVDYMHRYGSQLKSMNKDARSEYNQTVRECMKSIPIQSEKQGPAILEKLKPIRIPLGTLPVAIVITPHIDFSLSFTGTVGFYYQVTSTDVSGYEIKDNVRTEIPSGDPKPQPQLSSTKAVAGSGSVSFTPEVGLGVGTEFAGSVGVLFKGIYSYTLELKIPLTFYGDREFVEENAGFSGTPKISLTAFFYVNFLELPLWNKEVPIWEGEVLKEGSFNLPVYPSLTLSPTPASITFKDDEVFLKYKYGVKKEGLLSDFNVAEYYPKLAIYKYAPSTKDVQKKYADENLVGEVFPTAKDNEYMTRNEEIKDGETYEFTYIMPRSEYDKTKTYAALPLMYNENTGTDTYFSTIAAEFKDPTPSINITSFYQTGGYDYDGTFNFADEDDYYSITGSTESVEGRDDLVQYEFTAVLDVNNPALMKQWGVMLDVKFSRSLIQKDLVISRKKSGQYTLNFSFISNYKAEDLAFDVFLAPYFEDENGSVNYSDEEVIKLHYPVEKIEGTGKGEVLDYNF